MYRESTLYTNTVGNTTNGESLTNTATATSDYNALECLNTLTITLDNLNLAANGITLLECWDIIADCGWGKCSA